MGSLEEDPALTFSDGVGCDESKCVSRGRSDLHDGSFTCYGDIYGGAVFPMVCADGFVPQIVEDEPTAIHTAWWGQVPVAYFTCCPPDYLPSNTTEADVTRQCSDPITSTIDTNIDSVCDNEDTRKYPRPMKSSRQLLSLGKFDYTPTQTDSFLCCDSALAVENENFLDEAECVPYRNEFYETKKAENLVGILRVISCDFPNGDFVFPRPVGNGTYDDVVSTGLYECCKTGPPLDPFIQDSVFKITIYPALVLYIIAALASAVVAIGLFVPLLVQLKNGTFRDRDSSNRRSSPARRKPQSYSTFNLYLVFLATSDLIYSLIQIGWYVSYMNQKFNPNFRSSTASPTSFVNPVTIIRADDGPITLTYCFANMWINAVISYQLLVLLRTSQKARRMRQPKLRTASLQCGAIYLIAFLYGAIIYILSYVSKKAGDDFDFDTVNRISSVLKILWVAMIILPIVFILVIGFLIWWGDYLPSKNGAYSARDRAMRQLAIFFLRIVAVFFFIWFPSTMLIIFGVLKFKSYYFLIAWCLLGIQPTLSTLMVLTKLDVRKYVWELMTLSCLSGTNDKKSSFINNAKTASQESTNVSMAGRAGSYKSYTSYNNSYMGSPSTSYTTPPSRLSVASGRSGALGEAEGVSYNEDSYGDDDDDSDDGDNLCYSVLGFVPLTSKDFEDVELDEKDEHDSATRVAVTSDNASNEDDINSNDNVENANVDPADGDSGATEQDNSRNEDVSEHEIIFVAENEDD